MNPKPIITHKFAKKATARRTAMQALYSLVISNSELGIVEQHYLDDRNPKKMDIPYFKLLLHNIVLQQEKLDNLISKHSSRKITQLDPIELCILRIACYELLFCTEIPVKVVIHESLELTSMFGSGLTSYKFINSVVDLIAKECRNT